MKLYSWISRHPMGIIGIDVQMSSVSRSLLKFEFFVESSCPPPFLKAVTKGTIKVSYPSHLSPPPHYQYVLLFICWHQWDHLPPPLSVSFLSPAVTKGATTVWPRPPMNQHPKITAMITASDLKMRRVCSRCELLALVPAAVLSDLIANQKW